MYTVIIADRYKFDCNTLTEAETEAKECLAQEGNNSYAKILTDNGVEKRFKKTSQGIKVYKTELEKIHA